MRDVILLLSFFAIASWPVQANQSATFRSQATQGWAWEGRSNVVKERIDLTIHSDHVDVEHELEIDARSDWGSPDHPNSLEILGDLRLAKGTVVTGLLLWNGKQILKGKLRTREQARSQYEDVVDRNVKIPPPPRDPALLEKTGEDNYALSIFPVSLNQSRKIRIRYLIPSVFLEGAHRILFPHAFSPIATVTVRGGSETHGYALTSVRSDGSTSTVRMEDAVGTPVTLESDAFMRFLPHNGWESGSGSWVLHITPLFPVAGGSSLCIGAMREAQGSPGYVGHFIFRRPVEFTDLSPGPKTRIFAAVKAGTDTLQKEITGREEGTQGIEELRVFSRAAMEENIIWRRYVNDILTHEKIEKPIVIRMEDGNQYARSFGSVPFYPLAKTMPKSLAAAWGFIDSKYALLALEQDTLKAAEAREYANAGVPALDPEDIFPEEGHSDSIPLSAWLLQRNLNLEELLGPTGIAAGSLPAGIRWLFRDGRVVVEIDSKALSSKLRVSLHSLDGKLLKEWNRNEISQGRLLWSPRDSAYGAGICLLRIVTGSQVFSARIFLR